MIVIALLLSLKEARPQSISSFAFSVYMPWNVSIRRWGVATTLSSPTWIFDSFRMFYGSGLFPQETGLSCLSLPFEFGVLIGSVRLFLSMRYFKESNKEIHKIGIIYGQRWASIHSVFSLVLLHYSTGFRECAMLKCVIVFMFSLLCVNSGILSSCILGTHYSYSTTLLVPFSFTSLMHNSWLIYFVFLEYLVVNSDLGITTRTVPYILITSLPPFKTGESLIRLLLNL